MIRSGANVPGFAVATQLLPLESAVQCALLATTKVRSIKTERQSPYQKMDAENASAR